MPPATRTNREDSTLREVACVVRDLCAEGSGKPDLLPLAFASDTLAPGEKEEATACPRACRPQQQQHCHPRGSRGRRPLAAPGVGQEPVHTRKDTAPAPHATRGTPNLARLLGGTPDGRPCS